MPRLIYKCPQCSKNLVLENEFKLGDTTMYQYKCGHVFAKTMHRASKDDLDLSAVDGSSKKAREYQADGVEFIVNSGFNCIIGDQMRLGKTPQSLLALKNAFAERTPALIIVKSANLWQWIREFKTWTSALPNGIFPIQGGNAHIFPGFSAYIISMDTFGLNAKCQCGHSYHEEKCRNKSCGCGIYKSNGQSIRDRLKQIPFRLVIVDEAHSFKNTNSNRSQALVDFIHFLKTGEQSLKLTFNCSRCDFEWTEEGKQTFDKRIGHKVISKSARCPKCQQWCFVQQQHNESDEPWQKDPEAVKKVQKLLALSSDQSTTEHERSLALQRAEEIKKEKQLEFKQQEPCGLILLTGTPILNRAEEYFVPLNLIAPEKFSSLERFRRDWLTQDDKGRWTRIRPYALKAFKETIAPYILRREWADVYSDLPELNKTYTLIEPDRGAFAKLYNSILDKMEEEYARKVDPSFNDMKEHLMELRRVCGLMKVPYVIDFLKEYEDEMNGSAQKWALGIHHESVRELLFTGLGGSEKCIKFSGAENQDQKFQIQVNFETSKQRNLIINMVAGGVGCDFHYVNNVLILERMWNSAMEEQFEARFYNPDKSIKKDPTNVEYIVVKDTFDGNWFNMIEQKRKVFGETVANNWDLEKDTKSFQELMQETLQGRL